MNRLALLLAQLLASLPVAIYWIAIVVGGTFDVVALIRRVAVFPAIASIVLKVLSLTLVASTFGAAQNADCAGGFYAALGLAVLLLLASAPLDISLLSQLRGRARFDTSSWR